MKIFLSSLHLVSETNQGHHLHPIYRDLCLEKFPEPAPNLLIQLTDQTDSVETSDYTVPEKPFVES